MEDGQKHTRARNIVSCLFEYYYAVKVTQMTLIAGKYDVSHIRIIVKNRRFIVTTIERLNAYSCNYDGMTKLTNKMFWKPKM